MSEMKGILKKRISSGLKRKSIDDAAKWACQYRVMKNGVKWSFERHPWLREMHQSTQEIVVGQKSAQMGYTETALNITLFRMDVLTDDCLYILPSKTPDASDFSSARFDPALELSPHLRRMFSDTKNTGHKRAGAANLYIRGSQSKSGLKSIPVNFISMDEVDEMNEENIALVQERASGQDIFNIFMISTPTIEGKGINKRFVESNQKHFNFKCPSCGRFTELIFPDCIVVTADSVSDPAIEDSHLICKECKNKLPHETKPEWLSTGIWVPQMPSSIIDGFHINQLYSCANAVRPPNIAKAIIKARTSATDEQELYNSKMGLTHTVKGAQIEEKQLLNCIGTHKNGENPGTAKLRTMGIDVNSNLLHVVIAEWYLDKKTNLTDLHATTIKKHIAHLELKGFDAFEQAVRVFWEYRCSYAVIDAAPERRKSLGFCHQIPGLSKICFYVHTTTGNTIKQGSSPDEPSVSVNRTAWLDTTLSRYKNKKVILPSDVSEEFKSHIKSLVRIYTTNRQGDQLGQYVKKDNDHDHFAHADNYAEIALPFAFSGATTDISNIA